MGVGSWLSRYLGRGLVARFITIELLVGLVGGFSSTILFLAFAYTGAFRLVRSALLFGMVNAGVALWSVWLFRVHLGARRQLAAACLAVLVLLGGGMVGATRITNLA